MTHTADVEIAECNTPKERRQFIEFQWEIYKGDPYWVPPLISERMAFYDKKKNPFFEHSDAQMFVARRNGSIVGTIVAILNNRHNQFHNEKTGFFGGFETINDIQVAGALIDAAKNWVKSRGMDTLRGPATLSLNEECGMLIEGFDSEPQVLMTYNPRYYPELLDKLGFKKAMDLFAWWVPTTTANSSIKQKLDRIAALAQKRKGFTVRNVNFAKLDQEVAALKHVYADPDGAWQDNWGQVPMNDHEINHIFSNLKQFADPEFIQVAELNGKTIGLGLTLPNVNRPLRKAYPNPKTPELWTLIKFLWYKRTMVNSVRVVLLGVLKEYRMGGVDAVLMRDIVDACIRKNYLGGEMSWILENNDAMNRLIVLAGSELYKKYRMYDLAIS